MRRYRFITLTKREFTTCTRVHVNVVWVSPNWCFHITFVLTALGIFCILIMLKVRVLDSYERGGMVVYKKLSPCCKIYLQCKKWLVINMLFFWLFLFPFFQIMGNQIHSFIISDKYAARVSNPYMYDTIRYDFVGKLLVLCIFFKMWP